jgi:molybdopterin/thiamine biosynthesis adenylyltransferase
MSPVKIITEKVPSPEPRFSVTHRQELITGYCQEKLTRAAGILIGGGGIGGNIAPGLCRKGLGHLRIFDHDVVEHTNLNRQHFFVADIGQNKACCLARNLAPYCHAGTTLEGWPLSFEDAVAVKMDLSADFVVCGVDNAASRVVVSQYYRPLGTPVIFVNVDMLAESGHVFVQESMATTPCFGCAFPNSLAPRKAPCFVPASMDILMVTAGFALYAIDSVLMDRRRNWNYRRIHLAGFAPGVMLNIERNPQCPLCSKLEQQGSPSVVTAPGRASTGETPL